MGMDDAYATVDEAVKDFRTLAEGLAGLEHRLDQYEAAQDTGELPPEMADMAELRDDIAAYFRETLPHQREIASWSYDRLDETLDDLLQDLYNPREAGFTPETFRDAKQTYHDAAQAEDHYLGLLDEYAALDQRAAELVGPEIVAQAKEAGRDVPGEPTLTRNVEQGRTIPIEDGETGTTIPVEDAEHTQSGAERLEQAKEDAGDIIGDVLDDLSTKEKAALGGAAALAGAAWAYRAWQRSRD